MNMKYSMQMTYETFENMMLIGKSISLSLSLSSWGVGCQLSGSTRIQLYTHIKPYSRVFNGVNAKVILFQLRLIYLSDVGRFVSGLDNPVSENIRYSKISIKLEGNVIDLKEIYNYSSHVSRAWKEQHLITYWTKKVFIIDQIEKYVHICGCIWWLGVMREEKRAKWNVKLTQLDD